MTLDQRIQRSQENFEKTSRELSLMRSEIQHRISQKTKEKEAANKFADDRNKVGKEVVAQQRLLIVENFSSGGTFLDNEMNNLTRKESNRLFIKEFDIFSRKLFSISNDLPANFKIATKFNTIEAGAKFKIVDFLIPENQRNQFYVLKDGSNKEYEITATKFQEYFEIKPLVKDEDYLVAKYLKKTTPEMLKSNQGIKALFCALVRDYRKKKTERKNEGLIIKNLELDDAKIKEYILTTKEFTVNSFNSFKPAYDFSYDEPLIIIDENLSKKLCFGTYFKDKNSFIGAFYFMPAMIEGNWKF
ncbi:hypothetical protein SHI21_17125 [Bacteriovorax sp. PP10]|uniref:Uncharacterized protein n=1 Tax=Bacteriovorax antarcticus TaxID=3088717 RepID=A0ABU5VYC5_9BACT|nr:hypothetical protein [Bacteriovorax sp. PP10]MEA9357957.1 hypothetical protein [Bacteriovorax sp. PP10]